MSTTRETGNCAQCLARERSILRGVDADALALIQGKHMCLNYRHDEVIFDEGQFPGGIYLLTAGKVKISKKGYDGREHILRFAKPGDILGYRSLLADEPFHSTATVIGNASLCLLPRVVVFTLIEKNTTLGMRFMRLLAADVRQAEMQSVHLAQKPVRERIAEAMLVLKETYGFEADQTTLAVQLNREDLASMAGTVRETATRLLSEFRDEGILELDGKQIRIRNMSKLIQQAKLYD